MNKSSSLRIAYFSIFACKELLTSFCVDHDDSKVDFWMLCILDNFLLKGNWELFVIHFDLVVSAGIHEADDVFGCYFSSVEIIQVG